MSYNDSRLLGKDLKICAIQKKTSICSQVLYTEVFFFTIPIALSSMLQQLFNAADTAIVGLFDTSSSLAAVGTNGKIIALIVALSSGLSVGVNVLVAQQIGQHKEQNIVPIIRTAMSLAVMIGVAGLIIGQCISAPLLGLIKTPSDILDSSVLYLRIYFVSYPFLLLYDFGSAILIICRLKKDTSSFPFALHKCDLYSGSVSAILKVGIPSAIQGAVFCFANIFVQASVNSFGSSSIAGSTIAMNFEYFTYYVITAFGQTATTFTSQNYSAGQLYRCRKILRICLVFSIVSSLILIEPLVIFRNFFVGFFSADQTVIQNACLRILCILFFEPLCNLYEIPAGVLRGTGHSLYPAVATIIGTCCFRIVWICTVFRHYHQLNILYYAFPISWVLTIILITIGFIAKKPDKTF